MKKIIAILTAINMSCASLHSNLDKFETAANALCDGISKYEEYKPQLEMIKGLLEKKDYMTALFYAKGLYTEAQAKGDLETVPEIISLITVLQNLASKVPLKTEKADPGFKTL
jgi:hypothetical protein